MIWFGNLKYIIYITALSTAVLFCWIFYMWWRRHSVRIVFKNKNLSNLLNLSYPKLVIKEVLIILSILCFILVLLRPQWGEKIREVHDEGTDLVIALDVSRSMLAADVAPSRLDRSKNALKLISNSLKGDRASLILFAGSAFMQCPLTADMAAFNMFLDGADTQSINLQGTNISAALNEALKIFKKKRITSRMLILLTDGEDHEGNVLEIAEKLKNENVKIYTIGIGRKSGEYIPISKDENSGDIFLKDSSGVPVRSSKNESLLVKLAHSTGGEYYDITDSFSGIYKILNIIEEKEKNDFGTRLVRERKEQYQPFAIFLLLLLAVEFFLLEKRRA